MSDRVSLCGNISDHKEFYRHMRARKGAHTAITATAHKTGGIILSYLETGKAYVDPGAD